MTVCYCHVNKSIVLSLLSLSTILHVIQSQSQDIESSSSLITRDLMIKQSKNSKILQSCQDNELKFTYGKGKRLTTCQEIFKKKNGGLCNGSVVEKNCPESCKLCPTCDDTPNDVWLGDPHFKKVSCSFLLTNQDACDTPWIKSKCPFSCNSCENQKGLIPITKTIGYLNCDDLALPENNSFCAWSRIQKSCPKTCNSSVTATIPNAFPGTTTTNIRTCLDLQEPEIWINRKKLSCEDFALLSETGTKNYCLQWNDVRTKCAKSCGICQPGGGGIPLRQVPTKLPTRSPTKSPTRSPTKSPTITSTKPPTTSPFNVPTKIPTKSPSNVSTKIPTKSPSNFPTKDPIISPTITSTVVPSPRTNDNCADTAGLIVIKGNMKRLCGEIPGIITANKYCRWKRIRRTCQLSCGACGEYTPTVSPTQMPTKENPETCQDRNSYKEMGRFGSKTCYELSNLPSADKAEVCSFNEIQEHCLKTCNDCVAPSNKQCKDQKGKIRMNGGSQQKCSYLKKASPDFKRQRCTWALIRDHCYKTCTNCIG